MRIGIVANYDLSCLNKQSECPNWAYKGVHFVTDSLDNLDGLVIFNAPSKAISVSLHRNMILKVNQEPYLPQVYKWQKGKNHGGFALHGWWNGKYNQSLSNCILPWHVSYNLQELRELAPKKDKLISCIASTKAHFPGHKKRLVAIEHLKGQSDIDIDFFGKGTNFIPRKEQGLERYFFSVAIENTHDTGFWTEKITDCVLCDTIPIHFGSELPDEVFPEGSYIKLPDLQPDTLRNVLSELDEDLYCSMLPQLQVAKRNILERHHAFPQLAKFFKERKPEGHPTRTSFSEHLYLKQRIEKWRHSVSVFPSALRRFRR